MKTREYVLGIDTSNYTTSVSLINQNYDILFDERIVLGVKEGQRGLRQSDAVFKHTQNLPILLDRAFHLVKEGHSIKTIAVSGQPRNIEDSYMPAFLSGKAAGQILTGALKCDYKEFSHQEGHIRGGIIHNKIDKVENLIVFHISGGTNEILLTNQENDRYTCDIVGQTKDISFGQLIDRIGVKLGYPFPSGKFLDEIACEFHDNNINITKDIYIKNLDFNVSGIETELIRVIENGRIEKKFVVNALFTKILICLIKLIDQVVRQYDPVSILFVGGVSASQYIRKNILEYSQEKGLRIHFSNPAFSTDNAVGLAFLALDSMVKK